METPLRPYYTLDDAAADDVRQINAAAIRAQDQVKHLESEIDKLAKVLMDEFGEPDRDESACEMAVRLLREYRDGQR